MSRFFDLKTVLSKLLIPVAVLIFIVFSFSVSTSAEIGSVEFTMEEEPVFIDEKGTDEILEFYGNATRAELFSEETNTFVKREITLSEGGIPSEKNVVVHTFRVTDLRSVNTENVSKFVSEIVENIFLELTTELGKKYVSTLIYMYGASYEVTYDPETGEVTEMLLHIALVVGDGFDQIDNIIETYIRPTADAWREFVPAKQIIELNDYILNGRFRYDVDGEQRKSTYDFILNGEGVCEEYAGLTALFLDELGFENMLIRGYATNNGERVEHVWNLVNVEGQWYHLDILWNGPIDENGIHTDITTDYLLKSTKTVKSTHLTPSIYYSYAEKATEDYDLSEFIYQGDIITPQMKVDMAKEELAVALDAAYDVCFRNSYKYTNETINRMMPIYTAAKAVYESDSVTLEEVEAQTETVNNALKSYVVEFVSADKTSLYKYLSTAYECMLYDYALYTSESVHALVEPYDAAVLVYQNSYATQKEVDAARDNLRKYINRLEKIAVDEPEDTATTTPENSGATEGPDNEVEPPVIVTPLPDETISDLDQLTPDDRHTETPDQGEMPSDDGSVETDTPVDSEQIPENETTVDDPTVNEDPENTETEKSPVTETPENNENDKPIVAPEKGISSDIIIYVVVALVALGGIIYLVVSKIRSKDDEDEETSEETNDNADVTEEQTAAINAEEPVAEKTEDAAKEEVSDDKKDGEDNSEENAENNSETAPVAEETAEQSVEENKTETPQTVVAAEVPEETVKEETEIAESEKSEEKKESEASEEKAEETETETSKEKTEETASEEPKEEKVETVDPEDTAAPVAVTEEAVSKETVEEKTEEKSEETSDKTEVEEKNEKTEIPVADIETEKNEDTEETKKTGSEEVSQAVSGSAEEKESTEVSSESEEVKAELVSAEELSKTEQKNQRKISRLMNYFKSRKD